MRESVLRQLRRGKRFKYYRLEAGKVVRKTAAEALEYELAYEADKAGQGPAVNSAMLTYCVLNSDRHCSICGRSGKGQEGIDGRNT